VLRCPDVVCSRTIAQRSIRGNNFVLRRKNNTIQWGDVKRRRKWIGELGINRQVRSKGDEGVISIYSAPSQLPIPRPPPPFRPLRFPRKHLNLLGAPPLLSGLPSGYYFRMPSLTTP
jgi:hypothetical protein